MNDELTPEKTGSAPAFAEEPAAKQDIPQSPGPAPTQQGGMFGITTETKSSNLVPIPAPHKLEKPNATYTSGWHFPVARLVNVICNPELEKKDGSKVPVLQFVFKTTDGKQYTHTEWMVDSSDAKFKDKLGALNTRVKHIWEQAIGSFPSTGIGIGAKGWTEYFNMIDDAFNSVQKDGNKVYAASPLFVKLVYYKGNLGFPYSPNFVERGPVNKTLTVNLKYDKVTDEAPSGGLSGLGTAIPGAGDMPDFDETYE